MSIVPYFARDALLHVAFDSIHEVYSSLNNSYKQYEEY